ncbi:MAG TPA: formimidoylglutamate deiminase [Steroidobacteraceae bacterium]|nr:formimidoylglutamate deiminase [Steroidobacteraceae bacterium]
MADKFHLQWVLLPRGWTRDVLVTVSAAGMITGIDAPAAPAAPADAERVLGFVVPGMPNAHSHAFQRALRGRAECRVAARDSFWTWRRAMYGLANRIEPDELQLIATQLYIEMLKSGYTSVAEFHYLHGHAGAAASVGANPLWAAVRGAARAAGIGLTLLPTLYQSSDFGGRPLRPEQARFAMSSEDFLRAIAACVGAERRDASSTLRIGAAFHSLRAVPLPALEQTALQLRGIDASMPVHIHVAEQLREVHACKRATGLRPIEWLLQSGMLCDRWCLVHCTHATAQELRGIATSGAAVCVSISSEANLGDGYFDALGFLAIGGRLCIGSDSQASVAPAEELRWMEYQQRLRRKRRSVLAAADEAHVGTRLWRDSALHGAQALGQPIGAIEVGRRADWLVLDAKHPALAGAGPQAALDHVIFAGADAAIRDTMVAGRWVVREHRHPAESALREPFAELLGRLST